MLPTVRTGDAAAGSHPGGASAKDVFFDTHEDDQLITPFAAHTLAGGSDEGSEQGQQLLASQQPLSASSQGTSTHTKLPVSNNAGTTAADSLLCGSPQLAGALGGAAVTAATAALGTQSGASRGSSGDDLRNLPDVSHKPAAAALSGGSGSHGSKDTGHMPPAVGMSVAPARKKKRLIPLKQVLQHCYEYHGLNELAMFCTVALLVTLTLYWHWGAPSAIFKATVQGTFQSFGNPDWQMQSMANVATMNDAVEYSSGWMEFWLQRAQQLDWPNDLVRAGDYGDLEYVRMLVNIDRNCDLFLSPYLQCYKTDNTTRDLQNGFYGINPRTGVGYANILEYAGWENVGQLSNRDSMDAGKGYSWWSYTMIAPKYNGNPTTRDQYIGRLYNITRNTCLNNNNCDWLATGCTGETNPCASQTVPLQEWFEGICAGNATEDVIEGTFVKRGNRSFVHDPLSNKTGQAVLDLKPFLSKYAYGIALDAVAASAISGATEQHPHPDKDRAMFSMVFQRSSKADDKPNRVMWQITTTVPVRTSFYTYPTDWERLGFECALLLCLVLLLYSQVSQFLLCWVQFRSYKPFFAHFWNDYEMLSTVVLLIWALFYASLAIVLAVYNKHWQFDSWDLNGGPVVNAQLEQIQDWAHWYAAWLYMGIVVDFLIFLRIARYMRIHVGLKAFYQVFIIAAREFLDFAVFLLFILVLLGSAVFAFFQLTGGNYQFLRFADGLSVMTRLTFGFLNYQEFQSQALGVGAAVSTVTLLFWVAVLLLVVYTQNIILAIVAEAYEEAKAKLGTAETSFLMLTLMRLLFLFLYILYRIRMLCWDIYRVFTNQRQLTLGSPNSRQCSNFGGSGGSNLPSPLHGSGSSGRGEPGSGGGEDDSGSSGRGYPAINGGSNAAAAAASGGGITARNAANANTLFAGWGLEPVLASTTSVMNVLPADVAAELGRAGRHLEMSKSRAARFGRSSAGRMGGNTASRMDSNAALLPDQATAGPILPQVDASVMDMQHQQRWQGIVADRLKRLWHGIVSERHDVRMYKDLLLAPKKDEQGWTATWKRRYWAPWCVARTTPVRGLMGLYQDFASYKLKEDCTWKEAYEHARNIHSEWMRASSNMGSSSSVADLSDPAAGPAGTFRGLPPLTAECFVDEDTLARLFLLTDMMAHDIKLRASPFHPLNRDSVNYLVHGISEVYGVSEDEDEVKAQLGRAEAWRGFSPSAPTGPVASSSSGSVDMRDAQLGQATSKRGGFFSNLNLKRREGGAEQSKQLGLLVHTHRRLEETAIRTEQKLNAYRISLTQQANYTQDQLKEQQRQNSELLKSIRDLQAQVQTLSSRSNGNNQQQVSTVAPAGGDRIGSTSNRWGRRNSRSNLFTSLHRRAGTAAAGPFPASQPQSPTAVTRASSSDDGPFGATAADAGNTAVEDATVMSAGDISEGQIVAALQQQIEQQQQMLQLLTAKLNQQPLGQQQPGQQL
eukprot:GHRR01000731.1.p1 GENE.GHRR01000731.1~~GHRR01000731.1.p1  ORF type:complete len:1462 (+),score=478.47 GHRR01000731.1:180-4565(+)